MKMSTLYFICFLIFLVFVDLIDTKQQQQQKINLICINKLKYKKIISLI